MKKRIFSVLVALAVGVGLCSVCSVMAFAEDTGTTLTETLFLYSGSAYTGDATGFTWEDSDEDGDYDTLILTDDLIITPTSSSGYGIELSNGGTIDLNGNDLTITSGNHGIYATGNLTITGKGELSIAASSLYGINGSDDITIEGNAKVTVGTGITALGDLIIADSASVSVVTYAWVVGDVSFTTTGTITGIMSVLDAGNDNDDTVYGDITIVSSVQADYMFSQGTLSFASGSSLTINAGVEADWSSYAIDWDNANITNNGTIYLTSTDGIVWSAVTGSGTIEVNGVSYNSDGSAVYGTLDFSNATENETTPHYDWDNANATLTLAGDLIIKTTDNDGIILPSNGKIDLNGYDLTITSNGNGISAASGDITITGTGDVNIDADNYGIYAEDGDITIDSDATVKCDWVVADGDMTINGNVTAMYITSGGDITIGGTSEVSAYYIGADAGNITIGGTSEVSAYSIWANGNLTISGSASVSVETYATAEGTLSITTTGTVNGIMSEYIGGDSGASSGLTAVDPGSDQYSSDDVYADTAYGNITVVSSAQAYDMFYAGTLSFASGSSLTINADVEADWTGYTIDWANANIVNNGTISLTSTEGIDWSAITGSGTILVGAYDSTGDWVLCATCDNSGNVTYGTLDFSDLTSDVTTPHYTWDNTTGTLTLTDDFTITTTGDEEHGIILPDNTDSDATIDLAGHTLTISTSEDDSHGIYSSDDITITGAGAVNITADNCGIYSKYGDVTIENADVTIISDDEGIRSYENTTITSSDIIITSNDDYGIYAHDALAITNSAITITSDEEGISSAKGDFTITDSTIIIDSGSYGIYADGDSLTISGGTLFITADSAYGIYAGNQEDETNELLGKIIIKDGAVVTSNALIFSNDSCTISEDSVINGVVGCYDTDDSAYKLTVYGDVELTTKMASAFSDDAWDDEYYSSLSFDGDASLTIPAGVTLDLSDSDNFSTFTFVWGNGSLVVDGILRLNTAPTSDDFTNISGDGLIRVGSYGDGFTYYDTDGNVVKAISDNIYLGADTVDTAANAGYTWLAEDGTYTLTFDDDVVMVDGDIYIEVSNAVVFNVTNDIIVERVCYWGDESVGGGEGVTISGDGVLTVDELILGYEYGYEYEYGTLTIDSDVVAYEGIGVIGNLIINGDVVSEIVWVEGDLTINGDVTAGELVLAYGNMTINGTVVVVDEDEGSVYAKGDMTIAGDVTSAGLGSAGDLTINGDVSTEMMVSYGEMTVGSDATVVVSTYTVVEGEATISGDFTAALLVVVGGLTIENGATVTLTGIWMEAFNCTVALIVGDEDAEALPTLTLGDNISLLTPADGTYQGILMQDDGGDGVFTYYYGSIFTGDADWSNVASYVVFGDPNAVVDTDDDDDSSSSSSTSTSTSTSVTVTTDDTETYTTEDTSTTSSTSSSSATSDTADATAGDGTAEDDMAVTPADDAADTATSSDADDAATSDDAADDAEAVDLDDDQVPLAEGSSAASTAAAVAGVIALAGIGGGAWYYFSAKDRLVE